VLEIHLLCDVFIIFSMANIWKGTRVHLENKITQTTQEVVHYEREKFIFLRTQNVMHQT
jgi:hypothetical protein